MVCEQIFPVGQMCEKYLVKENDVFYTFIDMWKVLRLYGVGESLLRPILSLYVAS